MVVLDIPEPQACDGCLFCDYEQGFCFLSTTDGTMNTVKNVADYANGKTDKPKPEWCLFGLSEEIDTAEYMDNKLYIRDADESKGHLCNSLNALQHACFRSPNNTMVSIGYYLFRAQMVICYLRKQVNELQTLSNQHNRKNGNSYNEAII